MKPLARRFAGAISAKLRATLQTETLRLKRAKAWLAAPSGPLAVADQRRQRAPTAAGPGPAIERNMAMLKSLTQPRTGRRPPTLIVTAM